MSRCAVCGEAAAKERTLCTSCRTKITISDSVCAEQVVSDSLEPTDAALIDQWGRVHRLGSYTVIGRQIGSKGVALLESSVSRHHAEILYDAEHDRFTVRDLGSTNGTQVRGEEINDPVEIKHRERVSFGQVGFWFMREAEGLSARGPKAIALETVKPVKGVVFNDQEDTKVGLVEFPLRLVEPTGGGGGFIETADKRVQLTTTQFEFMQLLITRMREEDHQPDAVRGFVRSSELIARLSWDTAHPTDNHVKQLVRRIRRALNKAEVGNLIHSQHRFGYRLRVIPVADAHS